MRYYAILLAVALTAPSAAFAQQQQRSSATTPKPVVLKGTPVSVKKLIKASPEQVSRVLHGNMDLVRDQHDPDSRLYQFDPERGGSGCRVKIEAKSPNTVGQLLDLAAICIGSEPRA